MTGRDIAWRCLGSCLIVGAAAIGLAGQAQPAPPTEAGSLLVGLFGFAVAIAAITLLVRGEQVVQALKAELTHRGKSIVGVATGRHRRHRAAARQPRRR